MGTYKTRGIVLGRMNLGEADRIITLLTPDLGKIKAIAKGSRRIKSKLGGHLELFNQVDLVVAKGRNLDIVTGARLAAHYPSLVLDPSRLGFAYLVAEMVGKLVDEGHEVKSLFKLVGDSLADLEKNSPDAVAELYLKLNFLVALGYHPVVDRCVGCGRQLEASGQYWFNAALGGVVDSGCPSDRPMPITADQIKLWRLMLKKPLADVRKVAAIESAASSSLPLVDMFYDYVVGRRFTIPNFAQIH